MYTVYTKEEGRWMGEEHKSSQGSTDLVNAISYAVNIAAFEMKSAKKAVQMDAFSAGVDSDCPFSIRIFTRKDNNIFMRVLVRKD